MPSNIEWKARAMDFDRQRALAEVLARAPAELIEQTDTFFPTSSGRLKLRRFDGSRGELIHYHRPDDAGAKQSDYRIAETCQPDVLAEILARAIGTAGVVRKKRWLYLVGQTRLHFDEVEGLGEFIEVEVVMREGQPVDEGRAIAEDFQRKLNVRDEDLIREAYVDLISD